MSDEQPSLRLKPRSAPAATPPVPAVPAPEPPAAPTVPEADAALIDPLRLRLKPKAPAPEGSPVDTSGLSFGTPQPFSTPPLPVAPEVKPVPAAPPALPVTPMPKIEPVLSSKPMPPKVPPLAAQPVPFVPTPKDLKETPRVPVANQPPQHAYKADKWLAGVVVAAIVIVVAIYGVRHLFKANPKPKSAAHASASTEVKPAATELPPAAPTSGQLHLVDNPTSNAGKAVAKARDLVAAVEKRDQEQGVESVLSDTPTSPVKSTAAPAAVVTPPAAKPEAVAPAPAPEPVPELPPLPPSEAFRQFVIGLRVNGVFQGENARAMLNGKMYHLGDLVDAKLGITFLKFDVENKQLIFRDTNGAIMTRRF